MKIYTGTGIDHQAAAEVASQLSPRLPTSTCTHCGEPVTVIPGLLWVCTPLCYLDWFRSYSYLPVSRP